MSHKYDHVLFAQIVVIVISIDSLDLLCHKIRMINCASSSEVKQKLMAKLHWYTPQTLFLLRITLLHICTIRLFGSH